MGSPWDVAFGRLAVQQGLVAQEAVRVIYLQLPPGRSLKDELIARRLLAPDRAQALEAMLRAHPSARLPAVSAASPAADDSATMMRPAPAANADAVDTLVRPTASSSSDQVAAVRPAGATRLPEIGQVIAGRYELTGLLGKGGMGAVFKARDTQTGELYALKVLLPGSDPEGKVLARFRREAEAVAKVDAHAGIVRVRGLGEHAGMPYAVMDLVVGDDLHKLVKDGGPLEVARALRYTEAVARAVQHCHDKGVLHRDLKPANVLLRAADDAPLVMDFGLALDTSAERLTKTGEVMGTPAYMSPEQADGNKAETDARTDIYALGAILYALVKGRAPFEGGAIQIMAQVFRDLPEPIAVTRPDVPGDLDVIVRKAMAKDKKLRYETARDLADDVARLARGEPITARAPTAREELEWRVRRGDVRARLQLHKRWAIAAVVMLLLIPAGFKAWEWYLDARFASVLADVPAALSADGPLDAEGAASQAVVKRLLGYAPPGNDDVARLSALGDLAGPPPPEFERQTKILGAAPTLRRDLRTLARRLAMAAGRVVPFALPADATVEDRLMRALALLCWGRSDEVPADADVREARALLSALADEQGKVGAAAKRVLSDLAAIEEELDRSLTAAGLTLAKSVKAVLADASKKVNAPWDDLKLSPGPPQLARFARRTFTNKKPAAVAHSIAAITTVVKEDAARGWIKDRRPYDVISSAINGDLRPFVTTDPSVRGHPALADSAQALLTTVGGRTFEIKAEPACFVAFGTLIGVLEECVGGLDSEDFRRDAVDAVFITISLALEKGERPALSTIMMLPSLHRLPSARAGFEPYFKKALEDREIDRYVEQHKTGDGYLVWAETICAIRENDDRNDVPLMTSIREKYAAALGESLDAATRATLELGPAVALKVPLTPFFVPHAQGRLSVFTVRLEQKRSALRRPVIDAALGPLTAMRRDRDGRDVVEQKKLVRMEVDCLAELLVYAQLDPTWKAALEVQYEEVLVDEVELAWEIGHGVATGERREGYAEGSAGAADVRQDEDHLQKLLQDPIASLALQLERTGRRDGAIELMTRSLARYRGYGVLPFPDQLLRSLGVLRFNANDFDGAGAIARELLEETRLRPGADPKTRKRAAYVRSVAQALLASVLLRQGDAPGARALLEAARQEGAALDHGLWDNVQRELGDR